eukprot:GHVU01158491.1.p1 GENE.GHVU01158491.1~~GHVU01158491.1.p1  ORF type:complete len:210 (-),score=4.90 GHVU01158491.1:787-1416(-)
MGLGSWWSALIHKSLGLVKIDKCEQVLSTSAVKDDRVGKRFYSLEMEFDHNLGKGRHGDWSHFIYRSIFLGTSPALDIALATASAVSAQERTLTGTDYRHKVGQTLTTASGADRSRQVAGFGYYLPGVGDNRMIPVFIKRFAFCVAVELVVGYKSVSLTERQSRLWYNVGRLLSNTDERCKHTVYLAQKAAQFGTDFVKTAGSSFNLVA